jgi:hypothetical protein
MMPDTTNALDDPTTPSSRFRRMRPTSKLPASQDRRRSCAKQLSQSVTLIGHPADGGAANTSVCATILGGGDLVAGEPQAQFHVFLQRGGALRLPFGGPAKPVAPPAYSRRIESVS